jgi:hypothetical protein
MTFLQKEEQKYTSRYNINSFDFLRKQHWIMQYQSSIVL